MRQNFKTRLKGPVDVRSLFNGKWILRNVRSNETRSSERWDFGYTDRKQLITYHRMADFSVKIYVCNGLDHLCQTSNFAVPRDVLRQLERKLGVAAAAAPRRVWGDIPIAEYLANMQIAARARESRRPWILDHLYWGSFARTA